MNIDKSPSQPRRFARLALRTLTPAVLAIILAGGASAQDSEPPSLVGRIAAIRGDVSMHRADDQDWSAASVNEPVTIGDAIFVQQDADARIQIGATDFDLKSNTEIDIATLDQDSGRLRLDTGTLDLRVSALPTDDGLYILTPRGTVRLTTPGLYRIDAGTEDQPTQVTAWTGAAQMGDAAAAVTIQAGQVLVITGTPDAPQYSYQTDIGESPSQWRTPSRIVALAEQDRYIPPEMTGGEDLYQYGAFQTVPDYGTVWYPNDVPVDWQPYRYGHWEVVAPWGRTWIDDSPWGFAPFHYGRWAFIGNRWGWCPGEYVRHPVYAPALVSFVGGAGFGVSIGFGGGDAVGWVPLAPGEAYRPYYRAGPRYIENINRTVIVNNTTINNYGGRGPGARLRFGADRVPTTAAGFANSRFATVVPSNVIDRNRPVAAASIRFRPEALDRAQVNDRVVAAVRPERSPDRRPARPGPVLPQRGQGAAAITVRPALPPARGGGQPGEPGRGPRPAMGIPGAPNRPDARPNAPGGQPQRPDGRPGAERPGAATPPAAPSRPNAVERPAPGEGQAVRPAPGRPNAPLTPVQPPRPKPVERPAPGESQATRPAPNRPAMTRPDVPRPEARAPQPAAPRPETRPQPQTPRPDFRPQQAAPRPEPRPQPPAPRPELRPQPQAPRPQAMPQPQAPRPQPMPQPQAPRPEPRPQMAPPPQRAAPPPQPQPAPQQPKKGPVKPDDKDHK